MPTIFTLAEVITRAIDVGQCRRMTKLANMLYMPADLVESSKLNQRIAEELLEYAIHEFARTNHTQPF